MDFKAEYRKALADVVAQYPDEYSWAQATTVIVGNLGNTTLGQQTVDSVADRMIAAMDRGTFNHDGRAFRLACKRMGIPHTRKAIIAALAS